MPKYRFYIDYRGLLQEVYPVYNNSFTSSAKREEDKDGIFDPTIFEIDTTFTFIRQDVDFIKNTFGINETIEIQIHKSTDNGVNYNKIFDCYFYKLDCEFDDDERKISVKFKTESRYRKILTELDTEFDLIELGVEKTPVKYNIAPLFQTYLLGSDTITNYIAGTYEEQQITPVGSESDLLNIYKFGKVLEGTYIIGTGQLSPDVSGFYVSNVRQDGAYEIVLNFNATLGINVFEIEDTSTGTIVYSSSDSAFTTTFVNQSNASQETIGIPQVKVFCRYLSSIEIVDGVTLDPIPANDIVPELGRYSFVSPVTNAGVIITEENQTEPTFYNQFSDSGFQPAGFSGFFNGQYFRRPILSGNVTSFPISKVNWFYFSLWLYFDSNLDAILESAVETVTDTNAMQLHHVLSRILDKVDSNLTFSDTVSHSDFIYNASNPLRPKKLYPIITQKTNILFGNYDQAAQTAKVKLSEIFEFFKNTYYNFWFIDDSNRLRIEHERFFHKGGSYTTDIIGIDLTTETEPKTLRTWGYKTNKYTYDRSKIPQQIRFKWMDSVSRPFEGYPIDIVPQGLKDGTIEDRNTSRFTTDIDFAISQPNNISNDGFFWLEAELVSTEYVLPYVDVNFGVNLEYNLQNGYLANVWLIPNYHKDNLPVNGVFINENSTIATSLKRTRLQKVIYPNVSINFLNLIRTSLGEGVAREITVNHLNDTVEIEIEHDIQ